VASTSMRAALLLKSAAVMAAATHRPLPLTKMGRLPVRLPASRAFAMRCKAAQVSPTSAPGLIEATYQVIKDTPVTRASSGESLPMGQIWGADDTAVVCFLRHFG